MFGSTSVTVHLLRGAAALALVALAFWLTRFHALAALPALVGAGLLLRGCPMCWLMGLFETAQMQRQRRSLRSD